MERYHPIASSSSQFFPAELSSGPTFKNDTAQDDISSPDFNARYQRILDFFRQSFLSGELNTPDYDLAIQDLIVLEEEFSFYAETYGRLIVTELFLPTERKSFKPQQDSAGSPTVCCYQIIPHQKHCFQDCPRSGALSLRITAIVDYVGYRVLCASILNIKSLSHLDASLIKAATSKLNLTVPNDDDLRTFDFTFALPPTTPTLIPRVEHLYRRFRKEAIQTYSKPLCPTIFSQPIQNDIDYAQHQQDIQDATIWLLEVIIPRSATTIATNITIHLLNERFDQINLSYLFHQEGINLRYLGIVFFHLKENARLAAGILLIEIYARTIKNELRRLLRESVSMHGSVNELACRFVIIHYLNTLFIDSSCFYNIRPSCWEVLSDLATDCFFLNQEETIKFLGLPPSSLHHISNLLNFPFQSVPGRCYLFRRIVALTKLRIHESAHQRLERFHSSSLVYPITVTDFLGSPISTKVQTLLSITMPLFSFYHSQKLNQPTLEFGSNIARLKSLAARSPSHPFLIAHLAFAMSFHLSFQKPPSGDLAYHETEELFAKTINHLGSEHTKALALCYLKYGRFQILRGEIDRANIYLVKALELNPKSSHICEIFVQFLKDYYPNKKMQIRKYNERTAILSQYPLASVTYEAIIHPITHFGEH